MFNLHRKLLGEVPMVYRGGGKTGGNKTSAAGPMNTDTAIGGQLDAEPKTLDTDSLNKEATVDKKKLGTRGLQIPLTSNKTATAANTGVQV